MPFCDGSCCVKISQLKSIVNRLVDFGMVLVFEGVFLNRFLFLDINILFMLLTYCTINLVTL